MMNVLTDNFAHQTRDLSVANPDLLNPNIGPADTPYEDGEWVILSDPGAQGGERVEVIRATANHLAAYPVYTERGRTDTQAIQKLTVIFDFEGLEVETDMWEQANFANYGVGVPLTIEVVALTAPTSQAVLNSTTTDGDPYYAIVTRAPASNTDTIRVRLGRYGNHTA